MDDTAASALTDDGPEARQHPNVLLSCAISLDGFLDAPTPTALSLSSPQDRDAVDALRAAADVVLVGAGTVRRDDPGLLLRHPARRQARRLVGRSATPVRAVVTRSGELGDSPRLLTDGESDTRVYTCNREALPSETSASYVLIGSRTSIADVLADIGRRGARRILVEGGEHISSDLLSSDSLDGARIATSPVLVGRRSAPRLAGRMRTAGVHATGLHPIRTETLGDTAVVWWSAAGCELDALWAPQTDAEWLAEAVALAQWCPETDRAFNVGAVIARPGSRAVATGFSRETAPNVHAEECAIAKALAAGADLAECTLYTSMEPCSIRLSGRRSCVEWIREAGVRRVVYALLEPPVFVRCTGHADLARSGVEVVCIPELAPFAAASNARVIDGGAGPSVEHPR